MGRIMRPFNLDEYLKNPKLKVTTRDGRNVRIVCIDRKSDTFPIVVLIEGCYQENICAYTKDGLYSHGIECKCDLFFAPIKKEGWVNMYKTRSGATQIGQIYSSKEEAEMGRKDANYISTAKIEWEE